MKLRRAAALVILLFLAGIHASLAWMIWGESRGITFALVSAGELLALIALVRSWFWARWLVQGLALMHLLKQIAILILWQLKEIWFLPEEEIIGAAASLILLALISGRQMAAAYDLTPSPLNRWDLEQPAVRLLRWAVVLNIATLPMLLSTLGQGVSWLTEPHHLLAAGVMALLVASLVLVMLQQTAGLLCLLPAGVGTAYLALVAVQELQKLMGMSLEGLCGTAVGMHELDLAETAGVISGLVSGVAAVFAVLAVFVAPRISFLRR